MTRPLPSALPEAPPPKGSSRILLPSSLDGTPQPSCLHIPPGPAPAAGWPLMICLHGMGADETTWFEATPVRDRADKHGMAVACPFARGNLFYRGAAERDVFDLLDWLIATGTADPRRVSLIGHSMGAFGAWRVALAAPDRFAAIFPWSGFHPVGELPGAATLGPGIVHCADDEIVSVEWSRSAATELEDLEVEHDLIVCDGYGHSSRMIGDFLDAAMESALSRESAPTAQEIALAARNPLRQRAWWLAGLGAGDELEGQLAYLQATLFKPWEHTLSLDEAGGLRPAMIEVSAGPPQGFAVEVAGALASAGGPCLVVANGAVVADAEGRPVLLAQDPVGAPCRLVQPRDGWLLVEHDGSLMGTSPDRASLDRLTIERMMPLGRRARGWNAWAKCPPAERAGFVRRCIASAVGQWFDHTIGIILPADSIHPTQQPNPTPADLIEAYVRPEELLGVFQFKSSKALIKWVSRPRPFPLELLLHTHPDDIPADYFKNAGGMFVAIPLALAEGLKPSYRPGIDEADIPRSKQGKKSGPGAGWYHRLATLGYTPGMLAIAGVHLLDPDNGDVPY